MKTPQQPSLATQTLRVHLLQAIRHQMSGFMPCDVLWKVHIQLLTYLHPLFFSNKKRVLTWVSKQGRSASSQWSLHNSGKTWFKYTCKYGSINQSLLSYVQCTCEWNPLRTNVLPVVRTRCYHKYHQVDFLPPSSHELTSVLPLQCHPEIPVTVTSEYVHQCVHALDALVSAPMVVNT